MVITASDKKIKITFPVSSGLLDKNHYEKIGTALWEFLWLIDKVTDENLEADGQRWGRVLGGKVISADEIAEDLGSSDRTVKRNLDKLEQNGYIRTKRYPRGKVIDVRKSIKWLVRFHGASTAVQKQECENSSPSNQVAELVASYRQISGVVAQERDFGAIGKLCKEFNADMVADSLGKLKKALQKSSAKIKDPLTYLAGILQKSKTPVVVDIADKKQKSEKECSKCHGKGWYLVKESFANGTAKKDRVVTCECRKKKPAWAAQ